MIPLRDENPTRRIPVLTIGLIALCALVWAFQVSKPDDGTLGSQQAFVCEYGFAPDNLLGGGGRQPQDLCDELNEERPSELTLFTSQFLHADFFHLLFNMLFLWVFGNNIEDRLGRIRFLPFFLMCGAAAAIAQGLADTGSAIPLIGASGAISGVLGAYLVLYPQVRVWTIVLPFFFLPFKLPAWLWLAIYFALQFLYLGDSTTAQGGGVAYWAHIGGFIAGAALVKPFLVGRPPPPPPAPAIPVY